eukprot:3450583-Alexandrium_andersonii.AAC.1
MSASLVGSEMCIRDSIRSERVPARAMVGPRRRCDRNVLAARLLSNRGGCLLYTSDAADDM